MDGLCRKYEDISGNDLWDRLEEKRSVKTAIESVRMLWSMAGNLVWFSAAIICGFVLFFCWYPVRYGLPCVVNNVRKRFFRSSA